MELLELFKGLIHELLGLILAICGERGVVRAFAVLNEHEVPIELGVTRDAADLLQLIIGVLAALGSRADRVVELHQLVGQSAGALQRLGLDRFDIRLQVRVALGAGALDQRRVISGLEM